MSTTRQRGPRGPISETELYRRLYAFGLGRAHALRAVAMRRALQTVARRVATLLVKVGDTLWTWQNRYNARRHMVELDARLLRDVGLTRADLRRAASRPFWKA